MTDRHRIQFTVTIDADEDQVQLSRVLENETGSEWDNLTASVRLALREIVFDNMPDRFDVDVMVDGPNHTKPRKGIVGRPTTAADYGL